MSTTAYLPDQSVSDNKKLDEEWYVPTYDYYIARCLESKNNVDTMDMINAANGIIPTDTMNYLLKPFNNEFNDLNEQLPYGTRDTNTTPSIVEKVMGEYIEQPYNFNVKFHDPDFATMQDLEMKEIIERIVKQAIAEKLRQDEASEQESTPEDIEAYINEKKKEYLLKETIKAKRFLRYINEKLNFDYYRLQMFYNWWTTEEVYVHRTIEDGEYVKAVIPPQNGYPYLGDNDFVEDGIAFMWKEPIVWDDFIMKYKNRLSKTQLDYLESLVGNDTIGGGISVPTQLITERSKLNWYRIDNLQSVDFNLTGDSKTLTVYHLVFKAFRKVKSLTYKDFATGKEIKTTVPKDYKLDTSIGDISLENTYIAESYYGARFGNENTGIYLKPEKHLVQREGKIPITGKMFILKNKKVNPVPYRLISYQVIDMIINFHIERTLAKYKDDILVIPKSILAEDKSGTTAQKTFYMMKDGRILYDDSTIDLQTVVQGLRLIQGSATDKYIKTLMELQQYYMNRANQVASMNEDRLGNIDTRGGVSNIEQNIYRSKLGTVLSLEVFRKILEKEHEADLEYAKYLFIDGVNDTMFDENGKPTFIEMNGYVNFKRSYGVYIENGNKADKKLTQVRQMAIAAAQNGDLEAGVEAIKSDNMEEIEGAIKELKAAQQAYEKELKAMESDNQRQAEAAAKELQAQAQANELEKINANNEADLNQTITSKEYDLTITAMNNDVSRENAETDAETARLSNETRERIDAAKTAANNSAKLRAEEIKAKQKVKESKGSSKK